MVCMNFLFVKTIISKLNHKMLENFSSCGTSSVLSRKLEDSTLIPIWNIFFLFVEL